MINLYKIENFDNLSPKTKEYLELKGITTISDLSIYTLDIYRVFFQEIDQEQKQEILSLMKTNFVPSRLENLFSDKFVIEFLKFIGINNLKDLLQTQRSELYKKVSSDEKVLSSVNSCLLFFYEEVLSEKDLTHLDNILKVQTKIENIDLEERARKHISQERQIYGAKTYRHFKIRIASPEEIRKWSYGEVKISDTVDYKSGKPKKDGLFCEIIFGPTKDEQCNCGKKNLVNQGQRCEKCGVEITERIVRRERMGHIELQYPIVHTWYLRNSPSRLALLLGIKAKDLDEVVRYSSYIVISVDDKQVPVKPGHVISEQDYFELQERYYGKFDAKTGGEAVKEMLKRLDLDLISKKLRAQFTKLNSKQKKSAIIKRLEVVEAFNNSDNNPEWVVMDVIPVIPPELRPMVPLDGGRFATTGLNDLYKKIINRNNRLRREKELEATELIIKNEKRFIQEAVDSLFDNSKLGSKAAKTNTNSKTPIKSLSDLLRGKQGRFRQNLLGKRVDYSGRSVIIVGPDLKMYQAGIPREMALTLFKPFVINEIMNMLTKMERDPKKIKAEATERYDQRDSLTWKALEKVVEGHPVLLNRAPTLHRLGIQAFEPKLIDGKAIRLHPLVTTAFNADFDGDQMAVHLPLSHNAQAEARLLMLASQNILNPKDGKPVVTPSKDMVLGNYYLTISRPYDEKDEKTFMHINEGMIFKDFSEVVLAFERKLIDYHTRIIIKPSSLKSKFKEEQINKYLVTTYGKLIFNNILPDDFPYINEPSVENLEGFTPDKYFLEKGQSPKEYFENVRKNPKLNPDAFKKSFLEKIIGRIFKTHAITVTSSILDDLKDLGFKFATESAVTIAYSDINEFSGKKQRIFDAEEKVSEILSMYDQGILSREGKSKEVIKVWEKAKEDISSMIKANQNQYNPVEMMADSGAVGSIQNYVQLIGMRGILANPKGEKIEVPVKSSFRQGLTVSEFFISTHGSRKGSTDTALKTASSGYLTRRLVDVAQDVIISQDDCQTERGLVISDIKDKDGKVLVELFERLIGRHSMQEVLDENNNVIYQKNTLITEDIAKYIVSKYKDFKIRTNLTCDAEYGTCAKCYGINLATNQMVEVGESVGVLAAQSIGEPGTQLTMRTFHSGGVASASDITQGLPRIQELFEVRNPKGRAHVAEFKGKVVKLDSSQIVIKDEKDREHKYQIDSSITPIVTIGEEVSAGQQLTMGSIYPRDLLRIIGMEAAAGYILSEVKKVYKSQEVGIADKHIEIIISQLLKRVMIIQEGDTNFIPGIEVSINEFRRANKKAFEEGKRPAVGKQLFKGITRAALRTESFLSAASFQETTRVLTDAAIAGKVDYLAGLKENAIIGGLIPAGTGIIESFSYSYPKLDKIKELEEKEQDE